MDKIKIGLYIHIPFCIKKCGYCDFLSMPAGESTRRHYVAALIREIQDKSKCLPGYQLSSVFFGGGTPSLLAGAQVAGLMEAVGQNFSLDPEIGRAHV